MAGASFTRRTAAVRPISGSLRSAAARPVRLTTGAGPDEAPTIAADGTIAFVNSRWRNSLEAHDLAGGATRTLAVHAPFLWGPAISPDGREVAFSQGEADGSWHIWSVPVRGRARQAARVDRSRVRSIPAGLPTAPTSCSTRGRSLGDSEG